MWADSGFSVHWIALLVLSSVSVFLLCLYLFCLTFLTPTPLRWNVQTHRGWILTDVTPTYGLPHALFLINWPSCTHTPCVCTLIPDWHETRKDQDSYFRLTFDDHCLSWFWSPDHAHLGQGEPRGSRIPASWDQTQILVLARCVLSWLSHFSSPKSSKSFLLC